MVAVQGMQIGRLPWGAEHHRAYRKLFCHRTGMVAICEDLPEEHNSVMLDPVLKDSSGIPAPKITYTLSENSRRLLDHAVARGSERRGTFGGEREDLREESCLCMETAKTTSDPRNGNWRRALSSLPGQQRSAAERKRLNHHGIFPMATPVAIALCRYLRTRKPRSMPPALLWERVPMCSR
jgi:hypothetical protein